MRTETKLGLVATYLLLSACGSGDQINPNGQAGSAGTAGVPGGGRNAGGRIYAIMPMDTGGNRNTGGQIIAIMPMETGGAALTGGARNTGGQIYAILPVTSGPTTKADAQRGSRQGAGKDDWWQAAEAALRST
jgi:hypothetical protein